MLLQYKGHGGSNLYVYTTFLYTHIIITWEPFMCVLENQVIATHTCIGLTEYDATGVYNHTHLSIKACDVK